MNEEYSISEKSCKANVFESRPELTSDHFYCSECHRAVSISSKLSIWTTAIPVETPIGENSTDDIDILIKNAEFRVNCTTCGKKMYEIDEKMIPIIYTLNTHGYNTIGCCEGHISFKDTKYEFIHSPYLYLENKCGKIKTLAEEIYKFIESDESYKEKIAFVPSYDSHVRVNTVWLGLKDFKDLDDKKKNKDKLESETEIFFDFLFNLITNMITWQEEKLFD